MSEPSKTRPAVPTGHASYVTTTQKAPTETGYVGYETTWTSWQKEVPYSTPKKP